MKHFSFRLLSIFSAFVFVMLSTLLVSCATHEQTQKPEIPRTVYWFDNDNGLCMVEITSWNFHAIYPIDTQTCIFLIKYKEAKRLQDEQDEEEATKPVPIPEPQASSPLTDKKNNLPKTNI